MEPELSVRDLSKSYGPLPVLCDVSFQVAQGEFLSIIGYSGCGKTTLLRVLAGFEPYTGEVLHRGVPVTEPSLTRFMVFQDLDQLLPWRTVRQNVLFGLVAGQSEFSADDLIDLVGLKGFGGYYPHQLSGGMKQRAAIARALFMDPSVLLMDEPFGSLDAHTRRQLRSELLRIWQDINKTIVFVTHNIRESVELSDRVLILSEQGSVKVSLAIDLPRPRDPSSEDFGKFWGSLLGELKGGTIDEFSA